MIINHGKEWLSVVPENFTRRDLTQAEVSAIQKTFGAPKATKAPNAISRKSKNFRSLFCAYVPLMRLDARTKFNVILIMCALFSASPKTLFRTIQTKGYIRNSRTAKVSQTFTSAKDVLLKSHDNGHTWFSDTEESYLAAERKIDEAMRDTLTEKNLHWINYVCGPMTKDEIAEAQKTGYRI